MELFDAAGARADALALGGEDSRLQCVQLAAACVGAGGGGQQGGVGTVAQVVRAPCALLAGGGFVALRGAGQQFAGVVVACGVPRGVVQAALAQGVRVGFGFVAGS